MDNTGISVTGLAISGTALTAIGGMIGAWIRARYSQTRIEPQPLEVKHTDTYATEKHLDAHIADNAADHSNIFSRLSAHDREISALQAQARDTKERLTSMDSKLDILLSRSTKL